MRSFLLFVLLVSAPLAALQKLPEPYRVAYGSPKAHVRVTEYFSFACPHCIALFREDFPKIKELIENEEIAFEFHPVPVDLTTVQAMACLETLPSKHKQVFLEVMLEEADEDPDVNAKLMIKAMELFKAPLPQLEEKTFLEATEAFQAAFMFLKQEDKIESVPSISINGVYLPDEVPSYALINQHAKGEAID